MEKRAIRQSVLSAGAKRAGLIAEPIAAAPEPAGAPASGYVFNEVPGTLIAATAAFCALLPFVALAGYLGGKAGGGLRDGLRSRMAGRSAE